MLAGSALSRWRTCAGVTTHCIGRPSAHAPAGNTRLRDARTQPESRAHAPLLAHAQAHTHAQTHTYTLTHVSTRTDALALAAGLEPAEDAEYPEGREYSKLHTADRILRPPALLTLSKTEG